MPTLAQETMVWPETLFDQPGEGQWWVLHVKPRAEKALARRCLSREAAYFLPQSRQHKNLSARSRESYLPLFPGYVFLFGNERDRIVALETNLVVNILSVPDQRDLFNDLAQIHRVLQTGLSMRPEERLQPGAAVTIVAGPLMGMEGTVIRYKNKTALLLKVSFLQQGASVELEPWMVEPTLDPDMF